MFGIHVLWIFPSLTPKTLINKTFQTHYKHDPKLLEIRVSKKLQTKTFIENVVKNCISPQMHVRGSNKSHLLQKLEFGLTLEESSREANLFD